MAIAQSHGGQFGLKQQISINVESTPPNFDADSSSFMGSGTDESLEKFAKTQKFVNKRTTQEKMD